MANSNYDRAELLKKIIFLMFSFVIMRFNYDNSISVGALSQNFRILDDIATIIVPLAILIIIYFLREHNYKYLIYTAIVLMIILIIDVTLIEDTDIVKLEKFMKYYPIYIILTYLASFMTDIASEDFRDIINKIQDKTDCLAKEYLLKIINIIFK